ncbi:MAG: hypothetical protein ACTHNW_07835 [Mucilaginibacter sp.]
MMKNRKPPSFIFKNFKWLSAALLIMCLYFIYFIPRVIAYPDHYVVRLILPLIIFLFLPILMLVTLLSFTKRMYLSIGVAAASVLIVGLSQGLLQEHREKVELTEYGVWTKGIVINRKHISNHSGGSWHWGIKCKYEVGKQQYETLYSDDLKNVYLVGDTIKVIYSSRFPKIYALGYEWQD